MSKPIKIVLTGAESTGKSTLAKKLAEHFDSIWIPEIAREFIGELERNYTYDDVVKIAEAQVDIEQKLTKNSKFIFFDTWLIITKVWFVFVFGDCPEWLDKAIKECDIDLFLVCDIDVPWVKDPLRENGGANRKKLHQLYLKELEYYKFKYQIVNGKDSQRLKNSIDIIESNILS